MSGVAVGGARVRLVVRGSRSLKEKRRVVRSIKDRLPAQFPVAVAEVGDLDRHQAITIGLAAVGNDGRHVAQVLEGAIGKLRLHPEAELVDHEVEIFHM